MLPKSVSDLFTARWWRIYLVSVSSAFLIVLLSSAFPLASEASQIQGNIVASCGGRDSGGPGQPSQTAVLDCARQHGAYDSMYQLTRTSVVPFWSATLVEAVGLCAIFSMLYVALSYVLHRLLWSE